MVQHIVEQFPELSMTPSIGSNHTDEVVKKIREFADIEAFKSQPLVISDRSRILSEWIYTPVVGNREVAYSFDVWMNRICALVMGGPHLVIMCDRSLSSILSGWDEDDQLEGVRGNLGELAIRYESLRDMLRFLFILNPGINNKLIPYNFKHVPESWIMHEVQVYIKEVTS